MIKILDNINITSILEELSHVQEVEWNDTRAWTNPLNGPRLSQYEIKTDCT